MFVIYTVGMVVSAATVAVSSGYLLFVIKTAFF